MNHDIIDRLLNDCSAVIAAIQTKLQERRDIPGPAEANAIRHLGFAQSNLRKVLLQNWGYAFDTNHPNHKPHSKPNSK
jgi:hypothetical protein